MKEKKTNLDVIKERMVNASDEEVADLCYRNALWGGDCSNVLGGFDCSKRTCHGRTCRKCFLDWLNEEADEMSPAEATQRAFESTEEKNDD